MTRPILHKTPNRSAAPYKVANQDNDSKQLRP